MFRACGFAINIAACRAVSNLSTFGHCFIVFFLGKVLYSRMLHLTQFVTYQTDIKNCSTVKEDNEN